MVFCFILAGEEPVLKNSTVFFQYYEIDDLKTLISRKYDIIEIACYTEMEEDDSIYCLMKKKKTAN